MSPTACPANEPRLRPLVADDAEAAADLSADLGYPVAAADLHGRLREAERRPDRACLAAVAPTGELLGWMDLVLTSVLTAPPTVEIVGLIVAAPARGRGVGRLLVERARAWATELGCGELLVRSRVERVGAHRFYRACGFRDVKTQHVFRLASDDAPR